MSEKLEVEPAPPAPALDAGEAPPPATFPNGKLGPIPFSKGYFVSRDLRLDVRPTTAELTHNASGN